MHGKKKIFITGITGYLGQCLSNELLGQDWCGEIHGIDISPSAALDSRINFSSMDINSPEVSILIKGIKPDIIIHLAFIVNPIHNEPLMSHVNVGGTRNILAAAEEAQVSQVMVASSGTAYGAWPDNPGYLKESDPIRPHQEFRYARDKATLEELCQDFMTKNKDVVFSIIRPCIVFGEKVDNYISYFLNFPIVPTIKGYDAPQQFVHDSDVISSIISILENKGSGAYNLAPADSIPLSKIVELSGKPSIKVPYWFAKLAIGFLWSIRLPFIRFPTGFLDYIRFPWVLDNQRMSTELGYEFKYSSEDTLKKFLKRAS